MHIDQIIDAIHPIPTASKAQMIEHMEEVSFAKNYLLLKADRVEKHIYFIKKGVVRAYTIHDKGEITFWFGEEGETILPMKSYVEKSKNYETIELLSDCVLFKINIDALQQLFEADIHLANWGRKMAEKEVIKTERRLISRELLSATKRYQELLKNQPSLIQRVPLKHIASYLGITPVSLSRVRKEK